MDHSAHLAHIAVPGGTGIVAALFLTGLVGGWLHCGPMCGPFVLAQLRRGEGAALHRLGGKLLLPYQLGRLTTYTLMGALAGTIGAGFVAATGFRSVLAALLGLGAVLVLAQGLRFLRPTAHPLAASGTVRILGGWVAGAAAPLLRDPAGWRGYGLGLALGFLPCGFLYAALVAASGAGSPLAGALAMAGFAVGTAAALSAVALAGRLAFSRGARLPPRLRGWALLANALILAAYAAATALA